MTHIPPHLPEFPSRAKNKGKSRDVHLSALFSTPAIAKSFNSSSVNPTRQYPSLIATVAGITPCDVDEDTQKELEIYR